MNYRHSYHAGNFADVLKHALLARIVAHLAAKDAPFRVIDTHAGIGRYDLSAEEAGKTLEWQGGIGRLRTARLSEALLSFLHPYLKIVEAVAADEAAFYPGSPLIAARLGRPQDRFIFNELHPVDRARLTEVFAHDRRVRVSAEDGFIGLKANLPPPERRGLTLIDPPFEEAGEFDRIVKGMHQAQRRFATGTLLAWYPIKYPDKVDRFHRAVVDSGIARVLRIEQWVRQHNPDGPLAGAGLLIVNPPWRLFEDATAILPELTALLAAGAGAGARVDWLVPEKSSL